MKLTDAQKKEREASLVKLQAHIKVLADMENMAGGESEDGEGEGEDSGDKACKMCEELSYQVNSLKYALQYAMDEIKYLNQRITGLGDELWKHSSDGHLPPIKSAAQMTQAISALGLNDEFDVQKRTIYANRSGSTLVIG